MNSDVVRTGAGIASSRMTQLLQRPTGLLQQPRDAGGSARVELAGGEGGLGAVDGLDEARDRGVRGGQRRSVAMASAQVGGGGDGAVGARVQRRPAVHSWASGGMWL